MILCLLNWVVVVLSLINVVFVWNGDLGFCFVFFNIRCVVVVFLIFGGLYMIICCGFGL